MTLASPKGGRPRTDLAGGPLQKQSPAMERLEGDKIAQDALSQALRLRDVQSVNFDAVFFPGGHALVWDLVDDPDSLALLGFFYAAGKPVAAIGEAAAVLTRVMHAGAPVVMGKRVTGLSNSEVQALQLTDLVPFLVEDELKRLGGLYEHGPNGQSFVVTDGQLITGQNAASSGAGARALIDLLSEIWLYQRESSPV